jgi:hypothetical protein
MALALAPVGCKKHSSTDGGGGGSTDATNPPLDAGPGTDAASPADGGGMLCMPQMGQALCSPATDEGYGTIIQFNITASMGSEMAPIDQVSIQVDIGGAMFAMPFLDPDPAAGVVTFPHMLGLVVCSPQYGAAVVTVEGLVGGTAVATGMGMTVPDTAACVVVDADIDLNPIADICGNGVVDGTPPEDCDGNSLDCVGAGCPGATGGVATCTAACAWDCGACT